MVWFKRKKSSTSHKLDSSRENQAVMPEDDSGNGPPLSEVSLPSPPDPYVDPAAYLRSVYAIRARSRLVLERAKKNELNHFEVDMTKFADTTAYVVSIIKRDYAPEYDKIPPHGRWQHFDVGGVPRVDRLIASWPDVDALERTRRLLDLFLVSVLLDAGAGNEWSYKSKEDGVIYRRSEGLALASLEMFKAGSFSNDKDQPFQVNGGALRGLTVLDMAFGFQVSANNPIEGLEGRTGLLVRLANALNNKEIFGNSARPGNMLDHLVSHPTSLVSSHPVIALPTLWSVLMDGLGPIWPSSRTSLNGSSLGDAWPLSTMPAYRKDPNSWESIVPFHKLTQWLTYSLVVPMQKLLNIRVAGMELLTGLPEYRNGGLLVDTGLLTLKRKDMEHGLHQYAQNAQIEGQPSIEVVPLFAPDDDVVVEWRAATIGFLDELLIEVNEQLGLTGQEKLSLPQMLEAGTWKGGREIAEIQRPNTRGPPIMIVSDGTVF